MPRADLSVFASALAERLPGSWRADYYPHAYSDQLVLADELWDLGIADGGVSEEVLRHSAVLTRADGARLSVIDRSRRQNQFIVAALEPDHLGYSSQDAVSVEGPSGIAVSGDPIRAACDIARRLLPRYEEATERAERGTREYLLFDLTPSEAAHLHVAFTWQDDGELPARPDHPVAAYLLRQYSFMYDRDTAAFVLPDTLGEEQKSRLIQRTALDLGALGISISVTHATPPPALTGQTVPVRVTSLHDLDVRAARAESLHEIVTLLREGTDQEGGPLSAAESFIRTLGARATSLAPEPLREEFTAAFNAIATRARHLTCDLAELGLGLGEIVAITQARGPQVWHHLLAQDTPTPTATPPSATALAARATPRR